MAVTHNDTITLVAGEALEPYRRVKYHSSAGQVVYADAADGDGWIGVTLPGPDGDATASGDPVTIELRGENKTLKVECSAAVTANASIYPENDGKISDDAGTVIIGTAAGSDVGAAGVVIEMHPNGGSGSVVGPTGIAGVSTTDGAIPILLTTITTTTNNVEIPTPARALKVVDAWCYQRGSTATSLTLKNGPDTLTTAAVEVNTTTDKWYHVDVVDAYYAVTAGGTLYASLQTADATGVEVFVLAIPT